MKTWLKAGMICLLLALTGAWAPPAQLMAGELDHWAREEALDDIARGVAMSQRGKYELAVNAFTRALESNQLSKSNRAIAHNNRGNAWADMGKPQKALDDYTQAIKIDPLFMQAYFNRSIVRYRAKDYKGSLADLTKVVQLDPSYASGHYNRSFPLAALGNFAEAKAEVRKAMELDPGNQKYEEELFSLSQRAEAAANSKSKD